MKPGALRRNNSPALAGLCSSFTLAAALLLAGCATPPQARRLEQSWPATLPARAELSDLPFFAQEDYECGPAALAMLLQAAGLPATPEQLVPQVYLPGRQGSLRVELLSAARRHGLPAYRLAPRLDELLQEVAAGHPVLVFQNVSLPIYPVWHYALLIGYDREHDLVRLHSGRTARLEMSLSTFERTWARGGHWAMVALPVDRLPATAEPAPLVAALAALERVDARAARAAYATALQRWPAQPLLLFGAGNTAYAAGDLSAAAAAYRAAVQAQPQAADAWNNLAQVLMEQGRLAEARQAVDRALALGGPRLASYQALAQRLQTP